MSISDKRSLASRINGAKSRGPVTARGKFNSQRANLRHAILSRTLVLGSESLDQFDQILLSLRCEFAPETAVEFSLIEIMAACQWRRMRTWALEKATLAEAIQRQLELTPELASQDEVTQAATAFRTLVDSSHSLDVLGRYETRFDREYHRALRRLLAVQSERRENRSQTLQAA